MGVVFINELHPKKLDKYYEHKLFKLPKGLVVCEVQAASPLALP